MNCRYSGFRDDEGQYTPDHWKILAFKLCFVIIFEVSNIKISGKHQLQYRKLFSLQHFVFGVCKLIDIVVPDIPESLDIKMKRERYERAHIREVRLA